MARRRTATHRRGRSGRSKKFGINTKLIMDVGLAGVATRILPTLVNKFFPLDPTLYTIVGAGGTYLVGSMLKKPDLANAGIALGVVELVAPMIENVIGGIGGSGTTPVNLPMPVGAVKVINTKPKPLVTMDDYLRLNDYVSNPNVRQDASQFQHSYSY